jgi:regulator of protease activity HflC (stomatin/prohibitin superfamily)
MADDAVSFTLPSTRSPRSRWAWALTLVAMGLGVLGLWWTFLQAVPADAFAVRQIYFGPGRGIEEGQVYGPGLHFVLPGYERLHVFPRDMQTLDFNDSEGEFTRARMGDDYHLVPSILIQTSEGYQVSVDATLLYRVVDPHRVLTTIGPGRLFETQVVQSRADKTLRQTLGSLDAEDFFNDDLRIGKIEEARASLTAELAEWGIQVWAVLVREYSYDQRYQAAIENRKIQDQRVFKNQAESISATRAAERDRVVAEGTARIGVEEKRGQTEVMKITAEADLYYRQRVSQGDLLVALAEAKGTRLENDALQSGGASNVVGLKMAEALKGTKVIILSTTGSAAVNPLDLDALLEGF